VLESLPEGFREVEERFWAKVYKKAKGGCWEWTAAKKDTGYGVFWVPKQRRLFGAHRIAWMLNNGEIPVGKLVLHKCDNPACINPSHLFLGNQQDNITDMWNKGRGSKPPNPSHPINSVHSWRKLPTGASLSLVTRFWLKVRKTDSCWRWTGNLSKDGRADIVVGDRSQGRIKIHRLSWLIHYGDIPEKLSVLHHCDLSSCVNPDHLWLGTRSDVLTQAWSKGKMDKIEHKGKKGSDSPVSKLNEHDVIKIKRLLVKKQLSHETIGEWFGVTRGAITAISTGKNWGHLNAVEVV